MSDVPDSAPSREQAFLPDVELDYRDKVMARRLHGLVGRTISMRLVDGSTCRVRTGAPATKSAEVVIYAVSSAGFVAFDRFEEKEIGVVDGEEVPVVVISITEVHVSRILEIDYSITKPLPT